ncbi:hypothetical protein FSP39_008669 [Pinctada imbricata]|uniref:Uncharacterized protein n=1 Tax=Pinctada imbricata TaxID=66713 RepID=A0AA88Y7T1_PINIB|nr:hypothetical protein FSP39_008669 [Pinctada imbricata]
MAKEVQDKKELGGEKVGLKKQITLLHGVAIIVGIIIGSGIFVSPVGILKETKSVGFSFIMWVICGVYNTLCAVCYAELGTTIPQSGGEYVYIKRAFGEIPAFVCVWINFLLICPVGIAASALIFSLYILKPAFPDCDVPEEGLALLAAIIICKFQCDFGKCLDSGHREKNGQVHVCTIHVMSLYMYYMDINFILVLF